MTSTFVLIFFFKTFGFSQEGENLPVRIMFYNVENLFDTFNDPVTGDDDFTPAGLMRWDLTRYNKKINSLYKTIIAAGEWSPPAIVGLCEIENRKVLNDLVYNTYLSKYQYGIIHEDSQDERGIDVAMIYRKDLVQIIEFRYWIPKSVKRDDYHTRSVLYAKCAIYGDTIHLIINHWPSRRGGVLAGEEMRNNIAEMVRSSADSLNSSSAGMAKIIIIGDFNSGPENSVIQSMINTESNSKGLKGPRLINLSDQKQPYGTYRYQGMWETIDQVIISNWFEECKRGLSAEGKNFKIFSPVFLLIKDSKYPGFTPFSTYKGYRYQGGFSDHLPILLDLILR